MWLAEALAISRWMFELFEVLVPAWIVIYPGPSYLASDLPANTGYPWRYQPPTNSHLFQLITHPTYISLPSNHLNKKPRSKCANTNQSTASYAQSSWTTTRSTKNAITRAILDDAGPRWWMCGLCRESVLEMYVRILSSKLTSKIRGSRMGRRMWSRVRVAWSGVCRYRRREVTAN